MVGHFFLSTHVLSNFVLIQVNHSVRVYKDKDFQKLQSITRMTPRELLSDPDLKIEFENLCRRVLSWETSWDCINLSYFQIYSRRMPAFEATNAFVKRTREQFEQTGKQFKFSQAVDL